MVPTKTQRGYYWVLGVTGLISTRMALTRAMATRRARKQCPVTMVAIGRVQEQQVDQKNNVTIAAVANAMAAGRVQEQQIDQKNPNTDKENYPPKPGVYLVRNGNLWRPNAWKIGCSDNIRRRIREHRATEVEYFLHQDYKNLENTLKKYFYAWFYKIDGKEYFIGDGDNFRDVFKDITSRFGAGMPQRPIDSYEYPIERIVSYDPMTMMYEVKWKYWPDGYNTWEPYSNIRDTVAYGEYTELRNYFDTTV